MSNLTTSLQIINSHVHIEKFYEIEKNKKIENTNNFKIINEDIIGLKDVSFKYLNNEINIFEDLNLKIDRNTHTVITGPNGSGKSTLLGLLAGVFYPNQGEVYSFSNKFGYIGATPLIFNSTLLDNIMY